MKRVQVSFLLASLLSGLGMAFLRPLLSLFLVDDVGVPPIYMGSFIMIMMLSGIVISQFIGHFSDSHFSKKALIYFANICLVAGAAIFAFSRNYWLVLFASVVFISIGTVGFPQLLALSRHFADDVLKKGAARFISMMRAQVSLAWIAGPPVAFLLAERLGFTYTFLVSALSAVLVVLVMRFYIPNFQAPVRNSGGINITGWYRNPNILMFVVSNFFLIAANDMYLIALPLHITRELNLGSNWAGYMMGTAAGLEIPVMLLYTPYVERYGNKNVLYFAIACGILFYVGMLVAVSVWQLILLQALNGIFIGIVIALAFVMIQDLMPARIGLATTLITNSFKAGSLLAGGVVGVFGQFSTYRYVFFVSIAACLVGTIALSWVKSEGDARAGVLAKA
jgi:SET family sugar efflux transporter-like MFS transporter